MNFEELEIANRQLAKALEYSDSLDYIKHIQSSIDAISMPSTLLAQNTALIEATKYMEDHASVMQRIFDEGNANLGIIQNFRAQEEMFERLIEQHRQADDLCWGASAVIEASKIWSSISDSTFLRFRDLDLLTYSEDFIRRLTAPSAAFSSFSEMAVAKIDALNNPWQAAMGRAAFDLIGNQFQSIANYWATMPAPIDDGLLSDEPTLNGPSIQFTDAIATEITDGVDPDRAMLAKVLSIKCVENAVATTNGVFRANEVSKSAKGVEIFKPTTRFCEACSTLPWIIAKDKKTFGDVIDALYFIFYEAPGKDKLRFLKEHGGALEKGDCDFIWVIKHLRNKYSRHDPDHGGQSDIDKSWEQLQEYWNRLGLGHAPYAEENFMAVQDALLEMAREFTKKLLVRASAAAN